MPRIPVYIFAGGRSSRFGSDKARALLDGQPLIARIAAAFQPIASRTIVVSDAADRYADLALTTIADGQPGMGPMGALQTALAALSPAEEWLLAVSCDLVVVEPSWVGTLLAHREPGALAVAFRESGDKAGWQPLLTLYHRDIAATVDSCIAAGRRSMRKLLDKVPTVAAPLPADWPAMLQINTREDLARQT
jgi:molybdopterin-guanine dinucleotide biosynthesis protein A